MSLDMMMAWVVSVMLDIIPDIHPVWIFLGLVAIWGLLIKPQLANKAKGVSKAHASDTLPPLPVVEEPKTKAKKVKAAEPKAQAPVQIKHDPVGFDWSIYDAPAYTRRGF